MEIAKGSIKLSPENIQVKHNITPAEALILHKLHFKNANGSPLGDDFVVIGIAKTVEIPFKAGEKEWYNPLSGKVVPAIEAQPEVSHDRTNAEEVQRLKRKYVGTVKVGNNSVPVFDAVFGTAVRIQLPQTFDEIRLDVAWDVNKKIPHQNNVKPLLDDETLYRNELSAKNRTELVTIAIENKVAVEATDENSVIVAKIMAARKAVPATPLETPPPGGWPQAEAPKKRGRPANVEAGSPE